VYSSAGVPFGVRPISAERFVSWGACWVIPSIRITDGEVVHGRDPSVRFSGVTVDQVLRHYPAHGWLPERACGRDWLPSLPSSLPSASRQVIRRQVDLDPAGSAWRLVGTVWRARIVPCFLAAIAVAGWREGTADLQCWHDGRLRWSWTSPAQRSGSTCAEPRRAISFRCDRSRCGPGLGKRHHCHRNGGCRCGRGGRSTLR